MTVVSGVVSRGNEVDAVPANVRRVVIRVGLTAEIPALPSCIASAESKVIEVGAGKVELTRIRRALTHDIYFPLISLR